MSRPLTPRRLLAATTIATALGILVPGAALADLEILDLLPDTNVLLAQASSGSGATSSVSSNTNIFSPAAYVDYKRFGGEPTVTVDRYPFQPGGTFKDLVYVSAPQGVVAPHFSYFWKSSDLGETFRVPAHTPVLGENNMGAGGGGDSHQAVGQATHKVFFVDLPLDCVSMNVSSDLGESFTPDPLGCGFNGGLDDRQWVEADEAAPLPAGNTGNVYVSFINFTVAAAGTLALARSTHDGMTGSFVTDSVCNTLTNGVGGPPFNPPTPGSGDNVASPCPDPLDPGLQVAGPVVADKDSTHNLYIPFVRASDALNNPPYHMMIAKSTDGGSTWTRIEAAVRPRSPINIFPQLTIDRVGNLYYDWAETTPSGETDVFYMFSTNQGVTWSPPIDVTRSTNKSAVFPWMVAGDQGQVDLVYYESNHGLNPNVDDTGVWNVIFGHSNNALNTGANFSHDQITDHPNHVGGICTSGLSCSGNRNLLDFFTIDVDHLGAAHISWTDDNNSRNDPRNKYSRQLSGNGVFANTPIGVHKIWPIKDHEVTDQSGDVFNASGVANNSCPGMDILGVSEHQSADTLSLTLTLNSAPTAATAAACSDTPPTPIPPAIAGTGGIWGAEFWAASAETPDLGPNENFYVAYRDNPPDGARVESGAVDSVNLTITSLEFHPVNTYPVPSPNLGGTCFTSSGTPTTTTPCTITITVPLSALGIKSGAALLSITGLSTYMFGTANRPPLLRVEGGNSEQADAATAFDDNGTGTTR
jgi:hypothetical protein